VILEADEMSSHKSTDAARWSRWAVVHPLLPYRLVLWLTAPLLVGYTLWRAARDRDVLYVKQRLGLHMPAVNESLWMHCASVGEVSAALPLLKALRARHPHVPLVITTNTPTGRAVLLNHMERDAIHTYLPLDFSACVARFIDSTRPRCAMIVETELWPNLYQQCVTRDLSLILINARLSDRTLKAPALIRRAYRHTLSGVAAILARSGADADKFRCLGAPPERVETLGNIKFARPFDCSARPEKDLVGRPYWLAASTHADEELRIAQIWRRLPDTRQLLVIAPRHPERRAAILRQLKPLGMEIAVRSRGDIITAATRIYLADTLGELEALMTHATLVLMCGSLIPRGGHNILEPARLGKPILVGRHMDNFVDETRGLLAAEAIMMARNDGELRLALERLLADGELRAALGSRAAAFMAKHADVAQIYLERLEPLCGLH
jgi:3-deoxy-D-manno-octulosonic-acid transferase